MMLNNGFQRLAECHEDAATIPSVSRVTTKLSRHPAMRFLLRWFTTTLMAMTV